MVESFAQGALEVLQHDRGRDEGEVGRDDDVVHLRVKPQRKSRDALSHSSPASRGQASCSSLHGSVTHAKGCEEKLSGWG